MRARIEMGLPGVYFLFVQSETRDPDPKVFPAVKLNSGLGGEMKYS